MDERLQMHVEDFDVSRWERIRWPDAKFEVAGAKNDLRHEQQREKREESRKKREERREGIEASQDHDDKEKREERREEREERRGKREKRRDKREDRRQTPRGRQRSPNKAARGGPTLFLAMPPPGGISADLSWKSFGGLCSAQRPLCNSTLLFVARSVMQCHCRPSAARLYFTCMV